MKIKNKVAKEDIDKIDEKIDDILNKQTDICIKLERCYHTIYGNGEKGLTQKIDELTQRVSTHSKYFWFIGIIFSFVGYFLDKIISLIK